jgi:hypothetical protein
MKTLFNTIFLALIPFLTATALIVMFVFGLVVAFYLLFWGLIIGAAIYVAAFFYRLLVGGKKRVNPVKPMQDEPRRREGRTFDYKDIK